MSLSGNIQDFGIPDVFQLISQQQKTGSLYLKHEGIEAHVIFDKGKVVLARFINGHNELLLGNLLLKAGIINERQLKVALEQQKKTLRSLGDVLLSMELVKPEQLSQILDLQREEVLFHIFQMTKGEYLFKNEAFRYSSKIIQPVNTQHILMDCLRMIDEWPNVKRAVGDVRRVFEPTEAGRLTLKKLEQGADIGGSLDDELDAAFSEFDESSPKSSSTTGTVPLDETEAAVLKLMDGRRNVKTITDRSLKSTFNVYRAIISLLEKGLIKESISPSKSMSVEASIADTYKSKSGFNIKTAATVLFILAVCGGGAILASSLSQYKEIKISLPDGHIPKWRTTLAWHEERLESALDSYFLDKGSYPITIDSLKEEGYIPDNTIKILEKADLVYKSSGDSYTISYGEQQK